MRKILLAKHKGQTATLWGDGTQVRELVFVDDVVDVVFECLQNPQNGVLNVSSGEGFTIKHLCELICEVLGYDPALVQYDLEKGIGAKSKVLSCAKLEKTFPSRTSTPLIEGIEKTLDWMRTEIL